ncbi:hypothetical protein HGRIS_005586 [Hohenbuehelia grisea]|uniref:Uncharacterized protein n=2 Tax=Hohenbuehelia grisea TaxID=104357 RepID=A0ABR3JY96_9AGAR
MPSLNEKESVGSSALRFIADAAGAVIGETTSPEFVATTYNALVRRADSPSKLTIGLALGFGATALLLTAFLSFMFGFYCGRKRALRYTRLPNSKDTEAYDSDMVNLLPTRPSSSTLRANPNKNPRTASSYSYSGLSTTGFGSEPDSLSSSNRLPSMQPQMPRQSGAPQPPPPPPPPPPLPPQSASMQPEMPHYSTTAAPPGEGRNQSASMQPEMPRQSARALDPPASASSMSAQMPPQSASASAPAPPQQGSSTSMHAQSPMYTQMGTSPAYPSESNNNGYRDPYASSSAASTYAQGYSPYEPYTPYAPPPPAAAPPPFAPSKYFANRLSQPLSSITEVSVSSSQDTHASQSPTTLNAPGTGANANANVKPTTDTDPSPSATTTAAASTNNTYTGWFDNNQPLPLPGTLAARNPGPDAAQGRVQDGSAWRLAQRGSNSSIDSGSSSSTAAAAPTAGPSSSTTTKPSLPPSYAASERASGSVNPNAGGSGSGNGVGLGRGSRLGSGPGSGLGSGSGRLLSVRGPREAKRASGPPQGAGLGLDPAPAMISSPMYTQLPPASPAAAL